MSSSQKHRGPNRAHSASSKTIGRKRAASAQATPRPDVRPVDGTKVKQLRTSRGWLQKELASKAGVAGNTVANAEAGKPMRQVTISALAHALGVTPEELILRPGISSEIAALPSDLQDYVCSFDQYVQQRERRFVGREFVFRELKQFLANDEVSSGYFIIQGEPGTGKSALIAKLAAKDNSLHHFNMALQGINTTEQFLGNICVRLIAAYALPHTKLPPDALQSGRFLNQLLQEAAGVAVARDQQVVILIDALDEVDVQNLRRRANILYLPQVLPREVYMVVTVQRIDRVRLMVSSSHLLDLDKRLDENERDLRQYLEEHVKRSAAQDWLRKYGLTSERLVDFLLERSEGNFMYVHRLIREIEGGHYGDRSLEALPYGLMAYYRGHWAEMRASAPDDFERYCVPIAAALATAQDAATLQDIAKKTGIDSMRVRAVLRQCGAFLDVVRSPGKPLSYRLYHSTFQKFVRDELGLTPSPSSRPHAASRRRRKQSR